MAGMVVLAILLVLSFVVISARSQNRLEVESSTALAETALAVKKREIGRNLRDYAVWEDAYRNLHLKLDYEWASTDGNVGANIYEGLGYDMAFVVRPNGDTVYQVINGVPKNGEASDLIPEGLARLVHAGVALQEPVVSLLRSKHGVALIAATAILPPSLDASQIPVDSRSALVFAKTLDDNFVEHIGSDYLLNDLAIIASPDQTHGAQLPLLGPAEETLAYITWRPDTPGYQLLQLLLPPLAAAMLALGFLAHQVIRTPTRLQEARRHGVLQRANR